MKHLKFWSLLCLLLLCGLLATACQKPDEPEAAPNSTTTQGLEYRLNTDEASYTLVGRGTSTEQNVIVAASYNGLPVTAIGENAFYQSDITSISIPTTVTSIEASAFEACTGLTKVEVVTDSSLSPLSAHGKNSGFLFLNQKHHPHHDKKIGEKAFKNCENLKDFDFPNEIEEIAGDAFGGCKSINALNIPKTLLTIPDKAFSFLINLESITVEEGNPNYFSVGNCLIRSSDKVLLLGCQNSVIPTDIGITEIADYAFWMRLYQKDISVVIPHTVTRIGDSAFGQCPRLIGVTFENGSQLKEIAGSAFTYCNFTEILLPDSLESLGWYNFYNCGSLQRIRIPEKLTKLEDSSFSDCGALQEIIFPANTKLETIGKSCFTATALTSLHIPASISKIGTGAFLQVGTNHTTVNLLQSITVADGNTHYRSNGNCLIDPSAKTLLLGCVNSQIPDDGSVTTIGSNAFCRCEALTNISIPSCITGIAANAFSGCKNLRYTSYQSGQYLGNADTPCMVLMSAAFDPYVSFEMHSDTKFLLCSLSDFPYLTHITLPTGILDIGTAFSNCTNLTEIVIPDTVTHLAPNAFFGCTKLNSVTLPAALQTIGRAAFHSTPITGISIPSGVKKIEEGAFIGCRKLNTISVDSANPYYYSYSNCLVETQSGILISAGQIDAIPANITAIGENAFADRHLPATFAIPGSVTHIGAKAFFGCTGFTELHLPEGVTHIGHDAFAQCDDLISVSIPSTVTYLESGTFEGCSGLQTVSLKNSAISSNMFAFCYSLQSITVPASVTSIGGDAFAHSALSAIIFEAESQLTKIDYGAFSHTKITSITIPASVTSIGPFYGCDNLTAVVFENTENWFSGSVNSIEAATTPVDVTSPANNARLFDGWLFKKQ